MYASGGILTALSEWTTDKASARRRRGRGVHPVLQELAGLGCESDAIVNGRADLFNEQGLDPQRSSLDDVLKHYKKLFMRV